MGCLHQPRHSWLKEQCIRGGRNRVRGRGIPRIQCLSDLTGLLDIWAHRDCQYAQGLHRPRTDRIPAPRRGKGLKLPSLTKMLSLVDKHLQRKKISFYSMESSWIPKPHLRIGHEPSNRWPTQNQHNSIFVDILSYIVSFGAFLISLVFFWYIITSDYGFCVCICVFFFLKKSILLGFYLPF